MNAQAGSELSLFREAVVWKNYWGRRVREYLSGDVLEVGAGEGNNLFLEVWAKSWTCLEPDLRLCSKLEKRAAETKRVRVIRGTIQELPPESFYDTILYVDVLEHVRNDRAELDLAAKHLCRGGHLVVLAPAWRWLYSPFDESVGHCRRYSRRSLLAMEPQGCRSVRCEYLDSVGLLASAGNRLMLKQSMPTRGQIWFWDRLLVRASRMVDPLLFRRVGKSVLSVWRKEQ